MSIVLDKNNFKQVDNIRLSLAQDGESKKNQSFLSKTDGNFSAQKQVVTREKMQYNKRHIGYLSYDKIEKNIIYHIRKTLAFPYSGMDGGIADGIAIEKGNTVYIVDSGNDNGTINFGVRQRIIIADNELRIKYIRSKNNDAISKGFVSDGLSSKFGSEYVNDRRNDRRQQVGTELSTDNRQPTHNEGRVSDSNAGRGIRGLIK